MQNDIRGGGIVLPPFKPLSLFRRFYVLRIMGINMSSFNPKVYNKMIVFKSIVYLKNFIKTRLEYKSMMSKIFILLKISDKMAD